MGGRTRLIAAALALAVVAALVVGASYLGGLLDPDAELEDMPLVVVDLDRGASFADQRVEAGSEIVAALRAPSASLGGRVRWTQLRTRADALARLARNEAYAALVIPARFSERVVALGTDLTGTPPRATLEILTNPSAGSYAGTFGQSIAQAAADRAAVNVSDQLVQALAVAGVNVPARAAARVGRPVDTTLTVAQPLGTGAGRGLAPFYYAVVLTIAAVVTATLVHAAMDWGTGRKPFELFGRELELGGDDPGSRHRFTVELTATVLGAVLVALAVSALALGPLEMGAQNALGLTGVAVLATVAVAAVALAFIWAFGVLGSLLAVLVTTILGVPSAGGVYPHEATPGVFRLLGTVLPLRYLTDAARGLLYFDATRPGVDRAIVVFVLYGLVGVVAGFAVARRDPAGGRGSALRGSGVPRIAQPDGALPQDPPGGVPCSGS